MNRLIGYSKVNKKFDNRLRSGNVPTNRQRKIYHQLTLAGINDPTDVTFGYVTTRLGDAISGIYVTCPIGWKDNAWMIAVRDPGLDAGAYLFPGDDKPDTPEVIVVPKTGTKTKGADGA